MIPSELDPDLNPDHASYSARRGDLLRRAADLRSFAHSAAAGMNVAVAGDGI